MRGIHGEPVDVWLRNDRPARFIWRGRMFTVMFVADRRIVPAPPAGPEQDAGAGRECWLLEATPERTLPASTFELCRDLASGRWLLSRT